MKAKGGQATHDNSILRKTVPPGSPGCEISGELHVQARTRVWSWEQLTWTGPTDMKADGGRGRNAV